MNEAQDWDELVNYLDRVRPGFRTRIRPAAPDRLSAFEEVIGRPIYPAFRHYLERMGGNDDDLFMASGCYSVSIDDLISGAVDTRDDECGPSFFENYIVFGVADVEVYGIRVSGAHQGRVVIIKRCEEDARYPHRADSLLGFIFGYGFAQEAKQLNLQYARISADASQRSAVVARLSALFQPERYSDSVNWYGRAPNMLADVSYYAQGSKLDIRIAARQVAAAIDTAVLLSAELKLPEPRLSE